MNTQPEALRLADWLESSQLPYDPADVSEAAAELRRLHAANIDCVEHFNALKAERDELLEALRDALSVARSVSVSRDRRIVRDGCTLYAQTEEWCKWVEDEVAPKLEAAIARATGGQA